MNYSMWFGIILAALMINSAVRRYGAWVIVSNISGLVLVLGGVFCACLIGYPLSRLRSTIVRLGALMISSRFPTEVESSEEVLRLARIAQTGGGILALANESPDFADGFLHRAVLVAIATGESQETRRIVEKEIRNWRINAMEDVNVLRTISTLAPMFGLMGTLLGMIQVMTTMSEPTKVGPAMAMALSSAFYGIAIANIICIPASGHTRLRTMQETISREVLLEGVLDILSGKPPFLIGVHLASYSQTRRDEIMKPASTTEAA